MFRSGQEAIVEGLITANADVNATNNEGSSALHLAAERGMLSVKTTSF